MASGTFQGSGWGVQAKILWSSTKISGGSTVSATLYAQNVDNSYWYATVNNGYSLTINGSSVSGNTAKLSSTTNGASTLISHSVTVSYTGDKSITISGTMDCGNIYSQSHGAYIGTRSASKSVALDKVGSIPPDVVVTGPTTQTISENGGTVSVTWNRCNDYSGNAVYRVQLSINGGSYSTIQDNIENSTLSYSYTIPAGQGNTYQFRVVAHNDIGYSTEWGYSGVVTTNKLNPPTIGSISTYNPYVSSTLSVPLSGGSQTNGGTFKRYAALYYGSTLLANCATPSDGNTSASITYSAANFISKLGISKYTDTFTIKAWIQNGNDNKSSVVSKDFTVNINSDGGATPTLGAPTFSGGALGNPATCFIAGISTIGVTSATASLRRAPSGTTLSYSISCTGKSTVSGSSASFSSLVAGTNTITVTVTDSRGLSTSVTKQFVVQSYAPPSIKGIKGERLDSPNTSGKITYTLSYSPIYQYTDVNTKGNQLNGINTQQIYKDSTWTNYTSGTAITGLNTELSYTFQLRVSDSLRTTTYTTDKATIPTITVLFAMREWGLGINCIPENGYSLCVGGNSKVNGKIYTINNGVTSSIGSDNSALCHYRTDASAGHWFNKDVLVAGDVYGGSSYNRRLAYVDETIHREPLWLPDNGKSVDNLVGTTTFAYAAYHGSPTTGTIVDFACADSKGYRFQIMAPYYNNSFYYRSRNGDNGTWLNWERLLNASELPYANLGTMGETSNIKININSTARWMLSFVVRIYQGYRATDILISGYNYAGNYWWSPSAVIIGDSTAGDNVSKIDVRFGYDSAYNLWVAFPGGNYTGVSIIGVTNGYEQISDFSNLFTITTPSSVSGTVQKTVTAYSFASKVVTNSRDNIYQTDGYMAVWSEYSANRVTKLRMITGSQTYLEVEKNYNTAFGCTAWSSDLSLKNSITQSNVNAIDKVNKIKLYDFCWNENGSHIDCGFISQQLETIDENFVIKIKDDNENETLQPYEPTIIPLLTKSIQELSVEIDKLKEELYGKNT